MYKSEWTYVEVELEAKILYILESIQDLRTAGVGPRGAYQLESNLDEPHFYLVIQGPQSKIK